MENYGEGELYAFPLFSFLLQLYYTERFVLALKLLVCKIETSVFASELSVCYIETSLRGCTTIVSRATPLKLSFGIENCLAGVRRMKENLI